MARRMRSRQPAAMLPLLMVAWAWPATFGLAQAPSVLRSEFIVSTYAESGQYAADVAADGLGSLVVVWSSPNQDGSGSGVIGRRLSPVGSPLGDEFQLNTFTTGTQSSAAVAANATGGFVVVWASVGQDGSDYGIFGQRFDAEGATVGAEFQVNTTTAGNQDLPKVAMSPEGAFVVVWSSDGQDGSSYGVFGQRFTAAGAPAGDEFQVPTTTAGAQIAGDVVVGSTGEILVVWSSQDQDGSGRGIYGRRFAAGGAPVAGEFPVNTGTLGNQDSPTVALDGFGGWLVTWTSQSTETSRARILGQRFASSGLPAGGEIEVSQSTEGDHRGSSIAADGSGTYFVAWTEILPNPIPLEEPQYFIHGRRLDAAGNPLEDEFEVSTSSPWALGPSVAGNGPQRFATSWTSLEDIWILVPKDIRFKMYAPVLFADGFESGQVCSWSAAEGGGDCA